MSRVNYICAGLYSYCIIMHWGDIQDIHCMQYGAGGMFALGASQTHCG